jgi:integrase
VPAVPKIAPELSPAKVRALMDKPGLHAVGGVAGLLLQVSRGQSGQLRRSWVLRTVIGARRPDIGLGSYPSVTAGIARDRAREVKEMIARGIDPLAERRKLRTELIASQATAITFADAAAKVTAMKAQEFRNRKHAAQWGSTLETYANPVIGKLPVADVTLAHAVSILEPIWLSKTETAKRLRGRIEAVLAWATVSGYRTGDNVARWKGNLDAILPKPGKVAKVEHYKAVPFVEIGEFMVQLRQRKGIAARAVEFAILTAARSGEVRGARWSEIDLQAKTWIVPAERMKAHKEHRVPLSDDAVALLISLERTGDLVFPAPQGGGKLSDMSLTAVLRRMKVDATVHGFRSSFKDWARERTSYPNEISEAALAHVNGDKTEAAYARGDLFEKRRRLMRDWAKFVGTVQQQDARVVSLKTA